MKESHVVANGRARVANLRLCRTTWHVFAPGLCQRRLSTGLLEPCSRESALLFGIEMATALTSDSSSRPSGKVRHDISGENFSAVWIVTPIGVDRQIDSGFLMLSDEVDGFGHSADKAA